MREFDRVALKGISRWKVGGNYAASLEAGERAHELGYSAVLYLDPREKKYIDECGPANFFAIKQRPLHHPCLGIDTPLRHQPQPDAARPRHGHHGRRASHTSGGACRDRRGRSVRHSRRGIARGRDPRHRHLSSISWPRITSPYSITTRLYEKLRAVQLGEEPDTHGWNTIVEGI